VGQQLRREPHARSRDGARYTEALFIQAIRIGKKPEGETLSPPMPWMVYRNLTDEDLKSIYAYLRTLKPVNNAVRAAYVAASPKGKNAMR
jgi:cytochrome c553